MSGHHHVADDDDPGHMTQDMYKDSDETERDSDARRFSVMAKLEKHLEPTRTSLARDPRIEPALKLMLPLAWCLNVGLYLWSNSLPGAAVNIHIDFNDNPTVTKDSISPILPPPFVFSLMGTVKDMWTAGVYPLAVIVFFMSGVWPYIKLVLMLFCWVAVPGKHISLSTRECVLKFLDAYGKWSLLDSFMMMVMMVAFHMDFNTVAMSMVLLPLQLLNLDSLLFFDFAVQVIPMWGFYAFVFATMMSLVVGHVVSHAHRMQIDDARHTKKRVGKVKIMEAVAEHDAAEIMHIECCPCLCFPVCEMPQGFATAVMVGFLCPLTLFFMILGFSVESFAFTSGGVAGWALNTLSTGNTNAYSIWDLAKMIPEVVPVEQHGYVVLLQVLFLIFIAFAPMLYVMLAMVMWVVPLSVTGLQKLHMISEICYAWSCIDVFVVTVIATILQIGQFVGFMTQAFHCDLLKTALETVPAVLAMVGGDANCFTVEAETRVGMIYLIIAAVLSHLIAFFMDMSVVQALKDRTGMTALEMQLAGLQLPQESQRRGSRGSGLRNDPAQAAGDDPQYSEVGLDASFEVGDISSPSPVVASVAKGAGAGSTNRGASFQEPSSVAAVTAVQSV